MNKILDYFINPSLKKDWEQFRRARLFAALLLISLLFPIFGIIDSTSQLDIITYELLYLSASALTGLLVIRFNGNLDFLGNFYAFTSWSGFSIIIYHSGGLDSPAFEWLLVSIIPAYIFCGKKGGNFWWIVNLLTAIIFAFLQKFMESGPITMFTDLVFLRDTSFSIGLLIFIPLVVQFFNKTNEEIKSSLKDLNFDLLETQKLIKSSEEKFKAIVDGFPNGTITILDNKYRIIDAFGTIVKQYSKEVYEGWLGKTMEEIIGTNEFLKRKEFYDVGLSGQIVSFESEYENEFFLNSISPLYDQKNEVTKILIASQLITDIKKTQLELDTSKYLLRKIIDTAPLFISQINKEGYYVTANIKLSNYLGIPCEEIEGKHYSEVISSEMIDQFEINLQKAKEKGKFSDLVKLKTDDGYIYNNYIISSTWDKDNNHLGYVVVGIDITELKEQEFDLIEKNQLLNDSHTYAKRIQQGILGNIDEIKSLLKDSFIYFNPKEELSGDFFWCGTRDNKKIIIAGDCTGHGVPGALLTIVGINLLNEIINVYGMIKPDLILYQLDQKVTDILINKKDVENVQDGMDMAVVVIDEKENTLEFSGAKNPIYVCKQNGDCKRFRGSKYPIGSSHYGSNKVYNRDKIELEKGDMVYLYSDGFQDQMGGHNGKKYMAKNFRELLDHISLVNSTSHQHDLLEKSFIDWKSDRDQTDDVLIIGFRY